jgi:hypothetical protein
MTRRETLRLGAAMFAGMLLAACVTPNGYQARIEPAGSGYAEERIAETRWRVEFTGGPNDTRDVVESYVLYRAAELTTSSGYDWFIPSAQEVDTETEVVVQAQRTRESPVWRPQWRRNRYSRWTDWMPAGAIPQEILERSTAQVTTRERFAAREEITMGRGPAPSGAFEARRVLSDLAPAISGS